MLAAEKLIAEHGIRNVTIRQIVRAAGQRNESALQYHFGNLQGLIDTLRYERNTELQRRRTVMLEDLLAQCAEPSLRSLCEVMAWPAFELAGGAPEFRRYVIAFSQEVIFAESSELEVVDRHAGATGRHLGRLLRGLLPHLDEAAYRRRMDAAVRLAAVSLSHYARQMDTFGEREADLHFHSLIDALVGLLEAPVSETTRRLARAPG
ncbi:MAG: helix-turn-helix domain containing protein [Gammaproteobacteria bacterium]|nr:helix-turn-helix domain containing protein [Gammaproteobacteria bacterium]